MVLSLKTWESRSLQGLPKTRCLITIAKIKQKPRFERTGALSFRGVWATLTPTAFIPLRAITDLLSSQPAPGLFASVCHRTPHSIHGVIFAQTGL